jgi:hypothetical protein
MTTSFTSVTSTTLEKAHPRSEAIKGPRPHKGSSQRVLMKTPSKYQRPIRDKCISSWPLYRHICNIEEHLMQQTNFFCCNKQKKLLQHRKNINCNKQRYELQHKKMSTATLKKSTATSRGGGICCNNEKS